MLSQLMAHVTALIDVTARMRDFYRYYYLDIALRYQDVHSPACEYLRLPSKLLLLLRYIDSARCWNHFTEILVHMDVTASQTCCIVMFSLRRFELCDMVRYRAGSSHQMMVINRWTWRAMAVTFKHCSVGIKEEKKPTPTLLWPLTRFFLDIFSLFPTILHEP